MSQRRLALALVATGTVLTSCNATAIGFGVVSVTPIYGWEEGCGAVAVRGHGFDDGVTAKLGAAALETSELPGADQSERGFQVWGAAPAGTDGYVDVVVTNGDGETSTLTGGYRYLACTRDFLPEYVTPQSEDGTVAEGTVVDVTGCALGGATKVKVGDAEPVPLTLGCRTATATFTAPANPAGDQPVLFLNDADEPKFPLPCPDDDDTADTAVPSCDEPFVLTYGGAL